MWLYILNSINILYVTFSFSFHVQFYFVFNRLILIYDSQTRRFLIKLYVCSNLKSNFITQNNGAKFELDVNALDVYFNLTSAFTQLMNKIVPWKGAREKDFESIQISIKALRTPSYVVLDAYTSTWWFMTYFQNVQWFSMWNF